MEEPPKSCCAKKAENHSHDNHDHDEEHGHHHGKKRKVDLIYSFSLGVILIAVLLHALIPAVPGWVHAFAGTALEILGTMWWGVLLGIVIIGLMGKMPREYFIGLMGRDNGFSGLLRAAFGGVLLDVCCHGVLLISAKLYERGVGIAQVITFLVASPWNSISLLMVLITLIGFQWTMLYLLGSVVIALITGLIFQALVKSGYIPDNPNKIDIPQDYSLGKQTILQIKRISFSAAGIKDILSSGWKDGQMIIKWLLFGTVIAAASRTFIPHEIFSTWFGPTLIGLFLTVCIATIIEICSEGSAPMAGEFVSQANAPGNGFAFLMAGVATDYTEILAVREFTKSTRIALLLPLVTVPQVVFLAWLMNMAAVAP